MSSTFAYPSLAKILSMLMEMNALIAQRIAWNAKTRPVSAYSVIQTTSSSAVDAAALQVLRITAGSVMRLLRTVTSEVFGTVKLVTHATMTAQHVIQHSSAPSAWKVDLNWSMVCADALPVTSIMEILVS